MKILKKFIDSKNTKDLEKDRNYYSAMAIGFSKLSKPEFDSYLNNSANTNLFKYIDEYFYHQVSIILNNKNLQVLELGAGYGRISTFIAKFTNYLTVLDISGTALELNKIRNINIYKSIVSSMDCIPLEDQSIDVVIACESLSYSDPYSTDQEIFRIIKLGGSLIILDALNHNPIYIINRWLKVFLNKRSINSAYRIPTMKRIHRLASDFDSVKIVFFGKWIWLIKLLNYFIPKKYILNLSERCDRFGMNKFAFKFVLVAQNYNPRVINTMGGLDK
jgi:ubiquinone/menaquinone biosynthesis C-methylase UbiE